MQLKSIYIFAGLIFAAAVFLGNSFGRATAANSGNTGAPGDPSSPSGTCAACHNSGAFNPSLSIQVFDAQGQQISGYKPGDDYTARVTINHSTGTPKGFGFQMVALKSSDNKNIGTFSDVGTNNYKLKTLTSVSRTYAEQDNISATNTFNVKWKAPAAGSGKVTFYSAGNAVNASGTNAGDGAAHSKLEIAEGFLVSSGEAEALKIDLSVFPNPMSAAASVSLKIEDAGEYRLAVRDLAGRLVFEKNQWLSAGEQVLPLEVNNWQSGVYLLEIHGAAARGAARVLKI